MLRGNGVTTKATALAETVSVFQNSRDDNTPALQIFSAYFGGRGTLKVNVFDKSSSTPWGGTPLKVYYDFDSNLASAINPYDDANNQPSPEINLFDFCQVTASQPSCEIAVPSGASRALVWTRPVDTAAERSTYQVSQQSLFVSETSISEVDLITRTAVGEATLTVKAEALSLDEDGSASQTDTTFNIELKQGANSTFGSPAACSVTSGCSYAAIQGQEIQSGPVEIRISKTGYQTETKIISLVAGSANSVSVVLKPTKPSYSKFLSSQPTNGLNYSLQHQITQYYKIHHRNAETATAIRHTQTSPTQTWSAPSAL